MSFEIIDSPKPIETYVINLARRPERRKNVLKEFAGRSEFKVTVVNAIEDSFGALGLWKTLCVIIGKVSEDKPDYILLCEDDHKFTRNYSERKLRAQIEAARELGSDLLLGGASWVGDSTQISKSLFWVRKFSGLQFTIIFSKFFDKIINANLDGYDAADYKMSDLSTDILLVYPFLSTQRTYPYSDVTPLNNQRGRVKQLFNHSASKLQKLARVSKYYKNKRPFSFESCGVDIQETTIPTYIINLRKRKDRKEHIISQFRGRDEFQLDFFVGIVHRFGQVGLWKSIRTIVSLAVENNEDVIIICEDDHEFIQHYDKNSFIKNIIKAHSMGAELLLGGISNFSSAVKVDENLFWVDDFYCTQFTVLYKKVFHKILNAPYDDHISVDGKLSSIAVNKLVLYPFISIQKDFGYSDITIRNTPEIRRPTSFYDTLGRMGLLSYKLNHEKLK